MPLALNLSTPSVSLAFWLARNVPDLFLYELGRVRKAALARRIRSGLGQDDDDDDDDDSGDAPEPDASAIGLDSDALADDGVLSEDETPEQELGITPISLVPVATVTPDLATDLVPVESDVMSNVTDALQSTGSSVAPATAAATASAIDAVGQALTSTQEVANLANTALTYFAANSSPAMADVFSTQLATAAAGQTVQPLTTTTGADGTTTAAQVSTAADGSQTVTPLTAAQLAALTPSGLTVFLAQYGVYLGIGAGVLVLVAIAHGRRGHRR
jgi:hypothetical protein